MRSSLSIRKFSQKGKDHFEKKDPAAGSFSTHFESAKIAGFQSSFLNKRIRGRLSSPPAGKIYLN